MLLWPTAGCPSYMSCFNANRTYVVCLFADNLQWEDLLWIIANTKFLLKNNQEAWIPCVYIGCYSASRNQEELCFKSKEDPVTTFGLTLQSSHVGTWILQPPTLGRKMRRNPPSFFPCNEIFLYEHPPPRNLVRYPACFVVIPPTPR